MSRDGAGSEDPIEKEILYIWTRASRFAVAGTRRWSGVIQLFAFEEVIPKLVGAELVIIENRLIVKWRIWFCRGKTER